MPTGTKNAWRENAWHWSSYLLPRESVSSNSTSIGSSSGTDSGSCCSIAEGKIRIKRGGKKMPEKA
jgi:hypothetical protein